MTLLLAILLGIIQGLTEFLPVSSSGHLALFGHWLGLPHADINFDILVHLATLAAIALVYRRDLAHLILIPKSKDPKDFRLLVYLVLATLPAAVFGLMFKSQVESFHNQLVMVGVFLAVTGLVLLSGLLLKGEGNLSLEKLNVMAILAIGCAQAFAILPGISRSGMTIMLGLYFGLRKDEAARFSFLMALPAIGGAGLLMVRDIDPELWATHWLAYGCGFLVAFAFSLLALKSLIQILKGNRFFYFGIYCLLMASFAFIFN